MLGKLENEDRLTRGTKLELDSKKRCYAITQQWTIDDNYVHMFQTARRKEFESFTIVNINLKI
jgi:hypothetical protein